MKRRNLILFILGLCLGAALAGAAIMMETRAPAPKERVPLMNAAKIGGAFTLVDQDGKTRTEKDFNQVYKLVYFGFSYCPAICPTELQKISEALASLPEDISGKIQPIFITIDPERDTPAVLKDYVSLFDKRLIGLTGSVDQIEAVKKEYKVYASKVPQDDTYTMDHSSFIYFMTPDDKPVYLFRISDTAETMADTLTEYFKD
jgi:protein SCO1/2